MTSPKKSASRRSPSKSARKTKTIRKSAGKSIRKSARKSVRKSARKSPKKSPLRELIRTARKIHNSNDRLMWKTCIKQAGAVYRKKHGTRRSPKPRSPPCNQYKKTPRRSAVSPKGTRYCRKIKYSPRK